MVTFTLAKKKGEERRQKEKRTKMLTRVETHPSQRFTKIFHFLEDTVCCRGQPLLQNVDILRNEDVKDINPRIKIMT